MCSNDRSISITIWLLVSMSLAGESPFILLTGLPLCLQHFIHVTLPCLAVPSVCTFYGNGFICNFMLADGMENLSARASNATSTFLLCNWD